MYREKARGRRHVVDSADSEPSNPGTTVGLWGARQQLGTLSAHPAMALTHLPGQVNLPPILNRPRYVTFTTTAVGLLLSRVCHLMSRPLRGIVLNGVTRWKARVIRSSG